MWSTSSGCADVHERLRVRIRPCLAVLVVEERAVGDDEVGTVLGHLCHLELEAFDGRVDERDPRQLRVIDLLGDRRELLRLGVGRSLGAAAQGEDAGEEQGGGR